ncbi:hypothetical protein BGP75_13525 [Motiliproteus sp. MSK22-1]|nr:hypothetical protein BGP75_13525 [Motiliproteus sp. MSK22-1]
MAEIQDLVLLSCQKTATQHIFKFVIRLSDVLRSCSVEISPVECFTIVGVCWVLLTGHSACVLYEPFIIAIPVDSIGREQCVQIYRNDFEPVFLDTRCEVKRSQGDQDAG